MKNILKKYGLKLYGYIQIFALIILDAMATSQFLTIKEVAKNFKEDEALLFTIAALLTCSLLLILPMTPYFLSIKFCFDHQHSGDLSQIKEKCIKIAKSNFIADILLIVFSFLVYRYINLLPLALVIIGIMPCFNYKIYVKTKV